MKNAISFFLLLLLSTTIFYQINQNTIALYVSCSALVIFFSLQWKAINITGKIMLFIAAIACLFTLMLETDTTALLKAFSRASLFSAFLVSMIFLRVAAIHSELISKCSYLIINQKPSTRYGVLSFGSNLLGIILSFGTINLVGQIINEGNTLKAANGNENIHNIRRRRMSLALHRGFSTIPMGSPFSISMALILASIPNLEWSSLLPLSFGTAMGLIGLGWILDVFSHPTPSSLTNLNLETGLSWTPAIKFIGLVLILFIFAASLSQFLENRLPLAIMLSSPIFGIIWLYKTQSGFSKFISTLRIDLPNSLSNLHSEVAIIGAASFIGVMISSYIQHDQLLSFVQLTELTGLPLAFAVCCMVPLCALIGLSPLISVTVIATTLSSTGIFELSPYVLALSLLTGWALALNLSPIALSAILVGKATNCTAKNLTFDWNLAYCLFGLLFSFLVVFLVQYFGL